MKKPALIIYLTLLFFNARAQKTIDKPAFTVSNADGFAVDKVTLSDTATQVTFETNYATDTWFRMPSSLYLVNGSHKLKMRWATGISTGKSNLIKAGKANFAIGFAPISPKTEKIDLIETDCQQCFKVFDIELPVLTLPASVTGDWFTTDGRKQWIVGLYGNRAVYQNKLWAYTFIKHTGKATVIGLKSDTKLLSLTIKPGNAGNIYLTDDKNKSRLLCNTPQSEKHRLADTENFNLSQVYKGGTVEYSGFIKGYSPNLGYNTGEVFFNNIITGGQDTYLINIAADGSFKVKFPVIHARQCYVDFPFSYSTVYFEAGKHVFQKFDISRSNTAAVFMGDDAELNNDLYATKPILFNLNWDKVYDDILNFTPEQYKAYGINISDERLTALNDYKLKNGISEKAFKLIRLGINYDMAYFLLSYNDNKEKNYRKATNIAPSQNLNQLTKVKLDPAYLSFFKNIMLNDPLTIISSEYVPFINHFKYSDMVFDAQKQYVLDRLAQQKKRDTSIADAQFTDKLIADTKAGAIVQLGGDQKMVRTETLKKIVNTNITFDLQLMDAQDTAAVIERNFTPLSDSRIEKLRSQFSNVYVFDLLKRFNNGVKNKMIENKRQTDYKLNETPVTQADSIFATIINKYKGKTIYVDFWATWCAPCIRAIQEIAPLKTELKDKNVVFVYISNPTSPIGAYNGMIPGIKGEHYRVTQDEWNRLSAQFSISGIPHYVLVKNGIIKNLKYQHFTNVELKEKLLGE